MQSNGRAERDKTFTQPNVLFARRPQPVGSKSPKRWRRMCCLPYIVLYVLFLVAFVVGVVLSVLFAHNENNNDNSDISQVDLTSTAELIIFGFLITIAVFVGIVAVANLYTLGNVVQSLLYSPRRHLQRTVAKLEVVKSEGYLQVCACICVCNTTVLFGVTTVSKSKCT